MPRRLALASPGYHKWAWLKALAFIAPAVILAVAACTPSEAELIEGILRNVDSANGTITIETKDGQTVTLTISTDARVEADGSNAALEALEPGVSVEVDVEDDGQLVTEVRAALAKIEGTVSEIGDGVMVVVSERGRSFELQLTQQTRIRLEDGIPGRPADLHQGDDVEVKFDPESRVALKIDLEKEKAEIEGVIVDLDDGEITIATKRGRELTLSVTAATRIELDDDVPGTLDDLAEGSKVEVEFDAFPLVAHKIEVEDDEHSEIEGTIVEILDDGIIVETEGGTRRTLTVTDRTRVELDDDLRGSLDDLTNGSEVEVKFIHATGEALKLEVED